MYILHVYIIYLTKLIVYITYYIFHRDESEEDMEAHLLDSSTYNVKGEKAYSIDPEIDDDDEIFNKMEHLLA